MSAGPRIGGRRVPVPDDVLRRAGIEPGRAAPVQHESAQVCIPYAAVVRALDLAGLFNGQLSRVAAASERDVTPHAVVRLKREGYTPGHSDFILSRPGHTLYQEAKYGRNRLSDRQEEFRARVLLKGMAYAAFWTWEEGLMQAVEHLFVPEDVTPEHPVVLAALARLEGGR